MGSFFNADKGIFRFIMKLYDCAVLSMLFLLTSIPIFTIGASWSAMYYTVQKVLKNERGYLGKEYWRAFKTNFKQATSIWLIALIVGALLCIDIKLLLPQRTAEGLLSKAYIVFIVLLILDIVWCSYVFPYIARFENTRSAVMKNAAIIAILNLPKTIIITIYFMVTAFILCFLPFLIFVLPAALTWLQSGVLEKIFRLYMTDEDKEKEDERNRQY